MMQLPMRGLRINRHRDGLTVAQGRLEARLTTDLNLRCDGVSPDGPLPDASSPWQEVLEPPGLSDFSRFFGPLMSDILERRWLLCEQDMPLIHTALGMLEGTVQGERVWRQLTASTLASGDGWRFVEGDFLVRVANHLSEHDLQFYGVPSHRWEDVQRVFDPAASAAAVADLVEARCDLSMAAYEGIWAAFFESSHLLMRTFLHCSEPYVVYEIEEGLGPHGDWLNRCRASCPCPSIAPSLGDHRTL